MQRSNKGTTDRADSRNKKLFKMEIIDFRKGENKGALFIYSGNRFSACTAVESSNYFKTRKGAENWLSKRGYKKV